MRIAHQDASVKHPLDVLPCPDRAHDIQWMSVLRRPKRSEDHKFQILFVQAQSDLYLLTLALQILGGKNE